MAVGPRPFQLYPPPPGRQSAGNPRRVFFSNLPNPTVGFIYGLFCWVCVFIGSHAPHQSGRVHQFDVKSKKGDIFDNSYGGQQGLASRCPVSNPQDPPPHDRQGMSVTFILFFFIFFFVESLLVLCCFASVVVTGFQCRSLMVS